MTDLELTKLCADAMGLTSWHDKSYWYEPLTNDSQAMALVKKFKLDIEWMGTDTDLWRVEYAHSDESLNRAICKCIAVKQAHTNGSDNDLPL